MATISFKVNLLDERGQPLADRVLDLRCFDSSLRWVSVATATTDASGSATGSMTRTVYRYQRLRLYLKQTDTISVGISPEVASFIDLDGDLIFNFGVLTVFDRPAYTIAGLDYYAVDAEQVTMARASGATSWVTTSHNRGDAVLTTASTSVETVNSQVVSELSALRATTTAMASALTKVQRSIDEAGSVDSSAVTTMLTETSAVQTKLSAALATIESSIVGGRSADASLLLARLDAIEGRLSAPTTASPTPSSTPSVAATTADTSVLDAVNALSTALAALRADLSTRSPSTSTTPAPVATTPAPAASVATQPKGAVAVQDMLSAIVTQADGARATLAGAAAGLNLSKLNMSLRFVLDESGAGARALTSEQLERLPSEAFSHVAFDLDAPETRVASDSTTVTVPAITGVSAALARRLLDERGLTLLVRDEWADDGEPEGAVVEQRPAANAKVTPGTEVLAFIRRIMTADPPEEG